MSLDINPCCVYIVFDRCQVRMYIHGCFLTPPCVNAGKTFIVNAHVTLNNVFCSRPNPLQCFYRTMKMCPSTCVCLPVCLYQFVYLPVLLLVNLAIFCTFFFLLNIVCHPVLSFLFFPTRSLCEFTYDRGSDYDFVLFLSPFLLFLILCKPFLHSTLLHL